jgi:beta-glucosidase
MPFEIWRPWIVTADSFTLASNGVTATGASTAKQGIRQPQNMPSARQRAEALVAQMTVPEKVVLVSSYFPYTSKRREEFGMILSSGYNPGLPRLGVPPLRINDASLGVANILNGRPDETSTALPSALAMGASFDPEGVRAGSAMIGSEARAATFNVMLAGGINLIRDPWGGRNFEYFSEDALLTGVLGGAAVEGVQSNRIASTVKHFVLNSQETGRMVMDARIDMAALRESDLLAFQIAIERGRPASVMAAYNRINGDYASENAPLINGVLKGEWGYPGWVMSDWGSVHSTEKAALAGLDQESGIELDAHLNGDIFFTDRLLTAVETGVVPEDRLDDMVSRILTGLIDCGAWDDPAPTIRQPVNMEANGLVAQRVAEAGIVLLRNEGDLLPLGATARRIAVIGGNADIGVLSGGGSSQVRSHGGAPIELSLEDGDGAWFCRTTYHASSPLRAIAAMAPQTQVEFRSGDDHTEAAAAAAAADVAIVFATQWRSEAMDSETLALPEGQDALIAAVAAANPRTIVVLETGGAVLMPWLHNVGAVLAAWYPGQRGGEAIANVLFGEVNPSGRLPITFPSADADAPRPLPGGLEELRARDAARSAGNEDAAIEPFAVDYPEGANIGYRWFEQRGLEPLFPFGFGLSYTSFAYAELRVGGRDRPRVSLTVTNSGARRGADVVQVYINAPDSLGVRTWRLAGFARVELSPGQRRDIEIELEPRAFAHWDEGRGDWRWDERLPLAVGRSSRDFVLQCELKRRPR